MSEEIDYAERVQRGITLLDQKWPAWAQEINLDTLDIQNASSCMTAQYAGKQGKHAFFTVGQDLLGLDQGDYENHGFDADADLRSDLTDPAYEALNGLWRAAILDRRAQAQDVPAEPEATA